MKQPFSDIGCEAVPEYQRWEGKQEGESYNCSSLLAGESFQATTGEGVTQVESLVS